MVLKKKWASQKQTVPKDVLSAHQNGANTFTFRKHICNIQTKVDQAILLILTGWKLPFGPTRCFFVGHDSTFVVKVPLDREQSFSFIRLLSTSGMATNPSILVNCCSENLVTSRFDATSIHRYHHKTK